MHHRHRTGAIAVFAILALPVLTLGCRDTDLSEPPGVSARVIRTVPGLPRVALLRGTDTMRVGEPLRLITILPSVSSNLSGAKSTWTSSDPAVATVSDAGLVFGRTPGKSVITVTRNGSSDEIELTVRPRVRSLTPDGAPQLTMSATDTEPSWFGHAKKPAVVIVSPAVLNLFPTNQTQLTVLILDSFGTSMSRPVSWISSNDAVASVSADGIVTAVAAGSATITATADNRRGSATILVSTQASDPDPTAPTPPTPVVVPVANVTIVLNTNSLIVGQAGQATATALDANGQTLLDRLVTWSTSDASVATVSSTGYVNAIAPGIANISATVEGKSAAASLSVAADQPPQLSGVPLYPGDDLHAKVAAAAAGTQFVIKAGVHRRQTITPKSGMTFIGEPGAVLDGEGVTPYAFETLVTLSSNVTIRGLVITRYAPPSQRAAIQGDNGTAWLVADNEISYSAYEGLHPGRRGRVLRNYVHHNLVGGIAGYKSDSTLIEGNEMAFNGSTIINEDPATAEASGLKFLRQHGLVVRNNYVHDNLRGLWFDTGYYGTLVEGNTVLNNAKLGIWIEATYGAVVRNNRAERNGGTTTGGWLGHAGIQVTNSPDVEVYGNTVLDNMNGIGVMETSGYPDGPYGALHVTNLYVHDNTVRMLTGATGLDQNVGDPSVFSSRNNRFANNAYILGPNTGYFTWSGRLGLTFAQWQGYGQDLTGSISR